MNKMGDCHDLYLKTDVLLLADVFKKFIKTLSKKLIKLDSCHYFSIAALSFDVMLKMTGVELELICDIDMHFFIEKGIKSGISYICKRYSAASNKYMKNYDNSEERVFIVYVDANNSYGWAMVQYLPYGGFK